MAFRRLSSCNRELMNIRMKNVSGGGVPRMSRGIAIEQPCSGNDGKVVNDKRPTLVMFAPVLKGRKRNGLDIGLSWKYPRADDRLYKGIQDTKDKGQHNGRIVGTTPTIEVVGNHVTRAKKQMKDGSRQYSLLHIPNVNNLCPDIHPTQTHFASLLSASWAVVSLELQAAVQAALRLVV